MSLRRVGGANDEGIDLKGWWYVPTSARRSVGRQPFKPSTAGGVKQFGVKGPVSILGKGTTNEKGKGKITEMRSSSSSKVKEGKGDGEGEGELPIDFTGGFGSTERRLEDEEDEKGYRRLRVVGQCKAEGKKLNGRAVRELEGVMGHLHGGFGFGCFLFAFS